MTGHRVVGRISAGETRHTYTDMSCKCVHVCDVVYTVTTRHPVFKYVHTLHILYIRHITHHIGIHYAYADT